MNFVLLDDVAAHNDILAAKLTSLCRKNGWEGCVALKATTLQEVIAYAQASTVPSAYFLDIKLSADEDTLELYHHIQKQKADSYLIYVSAYPQYAMDCLHTHAFDFLLKPLADEQLEDCLNALWRAHRTKTHGDLLQISMGNRTLMLPQKDIACFTRDRMNVHCSCTDGSSYVWRESFDHLYPRLNQASFVQCHRGCIVNLRCIQQVHWAEDRLVLHTGQELPISRRKGAALRLRLMPQEEQV